MTPAHQGYNERNPLLTTSLRYPRPGTAVFAAAGEVDASTAPLLREQLEKVSSAEARHLVVDLSAVTFFCAAGVAALQAARVARDEERHLVLVAKTRPVLRVLDICEVHYPRYSDVDRALAACDGPVSPRRAPSGSAG